MSWKKTWNKKNRKFEEKQVKFCEDRMEEAKGWADEWKRIGNEEYANEALKSAEFWRERAEFWKRELEMSGE